MKLTKLILLKTVSLSLLYFTLVKAQPTNDCANYPAGLTSQEFTEKLDTITADEFTSEDEASWYKANCFT